MIVLHKTVSQRIRDHARSDYPCECCGVLLGVMVEDEKRVAEVLPISNAREEDARRNRFLITPDDVMRGEAYARRNKLDVLGYYHSHPDHPALPSDFDREQAWPFYSYVIVAVREGIPHEITSWTLADDRSVFNPEIMLQGA